MYFCSISSGSSGNCFFIGSNRTNILIDCGVTQKVLINSLKMININLKTIDGILVTHEHLDHYRGIKTILKNFNIPLYLNEPTFDSIKNKIGDIKFLNIIEGREFSINDLDIQTFNLPHDAVNPIGYSVFHNNKKISVATDIGHISSEVFKNIRDSHIVLLESNYNEEMLRLSNYPNFLKERILSDYGHLSNEECASAVVELVKYSYKRIILGHLSKTSNFPELAYKTVERIVNNNGIKVGRDLQLTIAHRSIPSNYMRI